MDEGQDGEFSSGSDTEEAGRGRKEKEGSEQNVDIQVNSNYSVIRKKASSLLFLQSESAS